MEAIVFAVQSNRELFPAGLSFSLVCMAAIAERNTFKKGQEKTIVLEGSREREKYAGPFLYGYIKTSTN